MIRAPPEISQAPPGDRLAVLKAILLWPMAIPVWLVEILLPLEDNLVPPEAIWDRSEAAL